MNINITPPFAARPFNYNLQPNMSNSIHPKSFIGNTKNDFYIQQKIQGDQMDMDLQRQIQIQMEKQQLLQNQYLLLQLNQSYQQQASDLMPHTNSTASFIAEDVIPYDLSKFQQFDMSNFSGLMNYQPFVDVSLRPTTALSLSSENGYYAEDNSKLFIPDYLVYSPTGEEQRSCGLEPPLISPFFSSSDSGSYNSDQSSSSPVVLQNSKDAKSTSQIFQLSNKFSPLQTEEYTPNKSQFFAKKISPKKNPKSLSSTKIGGDKYTSQPGPIPASPPEVMIDEVSGEERLVFSYSRKKVVTKFSLKSPKINFAEPLSFTKEFLLENCIYQGAMCSAEEYRGKRGNYERECNIIGCKLAFLNPEIRGRRGLIQRAVDSWRNTRDDLKIRSRRVRKEHRMRRKRETSLL